MSLGSTLLFLPESICVFWLLAFIIFSPMEVVYRKATRLFAVMSGFFLFAILSSNLSGRVLLQRILFEQVLALAIVPCFVSYNRRSINSKAIGPIYTACCVIPYFHLTTAMMVVFVCGYQSALDVVILSMGNAGSVLKLLEDRAQVAVYVCYKYVFKSFLLIEFMFFATHYMSRTISNGVTLKDIFKFFGGKHRTSVANVRYSLATIFLVVIYGALFIGKGYYPHSTAMLCVGYVLLLLSLAFLGFLCIHGDSAYVSLNDIIKASRFGRGIKNEYSAAPITETVRTNNANNIRERADAIVNTSLYNGIQAQPQNATDQAGGSVSLFDSVLDSKFEKYMIGENMFLDRNISIVSVAESLDVTKEELADYVESTYGMNFINYLNMLRIDYAEQYILNNEGATQKEIANACGFSGASSFNTAFSKITGVTPKIWKDRYVEMSKRG